VYFQSSFLLCTSSAITSLLKDLLDDDENDLHAERAAGSIDGVGWRFQSFKINDLEMVDQIFPRWNPLTSWMRQIEDFQMAA
jgi:hypothetical protein